MVGILSKINFTFKNLIFIDNCRILIFFRLFDKAYYFIPPTSIADCRVSYLKVKDNGRIPLVICIPAWHYFHNGLQPSLLSNKHIYYCGIIRSALLSKYCMLKNPRDPTEYTDNNVDYFRFTFAVDVSTSRLKRAQVHFSSFEFESLFFNIIC